MRMRKKRNNSSSNREEKLTTNWKCLSETGRTDRRQSEIIFQI